MRCGWRSEVFDLKRREKSPGGRALRVLLVLVLSASLPVAVVKTAKLISDWESNPINEREAPLLEGNVTEPVQIPPGTVEPLASPVGNLQPGKFSLLQAWDFNNKGLVVDSAFITKYGRHLVISFTDGSLLVHSFYTGLEQVFKSPVRFNFVQFVDGLSSNSAGILVAEYSPNVNGNVTLWQVPPAGESRVSAVITEPDLYLTDLAISPGGETLAVGYSNGEIRLFKTEDGSLMYAIPAHHDFIMALEFSWDNRFLMSDSFSLDPFTHVFRVTNGEKLATLATSSFEPGRISFSPDSQLAAVASVDGTHLFDTNTWTDRGFVIPTTDGIFTCDSRGVIVFGGEGAQIYSVDTGQVVSSREQGDAPRINCLFDGRTVSLNVDLPKNTVTLQLLEP